MVSSGSPFLWNSMGIFVTPRIRFAMTPERWRSSMALSYMS